MSAITLSGCGLVRELQRDLLFRPPAAEEAPSSIPGGQRWWLDVEGGQVEALYLPPREGPTTPAPVVIYAHSDGETIDAAVERVETYRRLGMGVLLPEYRGFGRSGGLPGEAAILGDYAHFYDRLVDRPEVDPSRIVFHGRELGGGVVGVLTTRRRTAALILESTWTNVPDLASRWWTPMGAVTDRFDTRHALSRGATPTLILHGLADDHIPYDHAVELQRVAWDAELVPFRAGRNLPHTSHTFRASVIAFLERAGISASDDAPP